LANKKKSDSNFLVVGVVRNCESTVKADVNRLQNALTNSKSISWLLVESDSDDLTLRVLAQLKSEMTNFNYIGLGSLRGQMPLRTERIAHCRNTYLEAIRTDEKYLDIDYVVVSDFDGMNASLNIASIDSCWERDNWDACTANQDGSYYDVWALRHPEWSPNDCFDHYRFMVNLKVAAFKAYYIAVYARMIKIPMDSPWIEVDSAFGGLGIYKKSALVFSRYTGLTDAGKEICEHVPLSKEMKRGGYRIFINPRLINTKKSEHVGKNLKHIVVLFLFGQIGLHHLKKIIRR